VAVGSIADSVASHSCSLVMIVGRRSERWPKGRKIT
jgi:hypothetical protein